MTDIRGSALITPSLTSNLFYDSLNNSVELSKKIILNGVILYCYESQTQFQYYNYAMVSTQ